MKTDIHPAVHAVVFVDANSGAEFATFSTLKSDKTKKINGVDHYVIVVDISSDTHPFFTGKQTLVDTAGRVDKFRAKMEAAKKKQEEAASRGGKKSKVAKETVEETITRKAKENTEKKEKERAKEKAKATKKPAKKAEKKDVKAKEEKTPADSKEKKEDKKD